MARAAAAVGIGRSKLRVVLERHKPRDWRQREDEPGAQVNAAHLVLVFFCGCPAGHALTALSP